MAVVTDWHSEQCDRRTDDQQRPKHPLNRFDPFGHDASLPGWLLVLARKQSPQ
jgi:hypothetical protein